MIALVIKRATHQEHQAGIFDSFKFIVEGEEFEQPHEAIPEVLMRNGFHVKPEDVDHVATLLARDIELVNANLRRIYGKAQP
tara:strand:+ start:2051 stop:2296 length:246 start_codon:yes stop_codon:yes gene_type:complete